MTTIERKAVGMVLDEHNRLILAKRGWFIANKNDMYFGEALLHQGEALEIEQQFLRTLVTKNDAVIDCGANIGLHTVGLCEVARLVIAIEPQPRVFRVLCGNLALNAIENVIVHNVGCSDVSGEMQLDLVPADLSVLHHSGGVKLAEGKGIPVVPLDDLVGDVDRLRLIKVDVETMEAKVLKGAARMIAKHRPLLYVENDMHENTLDLRDWLVANQYGFIWHMPALFNPNNYFGAEDKYGGFVVSRNLLCIPEESTETFEGELFPVEDFVHNNILYYRVPV